MLSIVKFIGPPGSLTLLVLVLMSAGVLAAWLPRWRRLAACVFAATVTLYLLLALPCVAAAIGRALPAVSSPPAPGRLDTLIILDGDNRRGRVEAALAAGARSLPRIWLLGDEWIIEALGRAGIPRSRIVKVMAPSTTREQMAWVAAFLAGQPQRRAAVIASRLQMPRVAALARAMDIHAALIAGPVDAEPPTHGWRRFEPMYIALRVSRDAIYEHAALALYRWRGWIGAGA